MSQNPATMLPQMTKYKLQHMFSISLTVIALVALTTAVILFAEQYTIRDGKIIQTGMIEIKELQNATIFLDGEERGNTPIALTYLEEGCYSVKIAKDNKLAWERSIDVVAGKVVTLFPILVPENLETEELFETKAVYATESPLVYFTVQAEGEKLLLKKQTIEKRLFDTSVNVTVLADLNSLPNTTPPTESETAEEAPRQGLLSDIEIYPSPTGSRALIENKNTQRYYLADDQKQNPTDITPWITMPITDLYWSSDENTVIVISDALIISVNLKNGQNILVNNSGDNDYLAVAPLKNRLIFSLRDSEAGLTSLYQVDTDGGNRVSLSAPAAGWGTISKIVEMEDKGILIIETDRGLYQMTSQTTEPELINQNGQIVGVDTEEQLVAVCGVENNRIYRFSKVSLSPYIKTTYPANCNEILNVSFINGGQNLITTLENGSIVFSTEDGVNTSLITNFSDKSPEVEPHTRLVGFSYHRQYMLIHFSVEIDASSQRLYRVAIEN